MKLFYFVFAFVALQIIASNDTFAQNGYELGARFGNYGSAGASLDGTMPLGANRLHGDLIFYSDNAGISVIYDWSLPFGQGLVFYPGLGLAVYTSNSASSMAITGELGIEYPIKALPLTIGLDWRPSFFLGSSYYSHFGGIGLNVRYRF